MKVIIVFIFLGISLKTYAQQITPIAYSVENRMYARQDSSLALNLNLEQQQYLRTHKTLKTLGWTSLGVGIASSMIAWLYNGEIAPAFDKNFAGGGVTIPRVFLGVGATLMVASIPLLIEAHHYKKKAANLSIGVGAQQALTLQQRGLGTIAQPAVTLSFGL